MPQQTPSGESRKKTSAEKVTKRVRSRIARITKRLRKDEVPPDAITMLAMLHMVIGMAIWHRVPLVQLMQLMAQADGATLVTQELDPALVEQMLAQPAVKPH